MRVDVALQSCLTLRSILEAFDTSKTSCGDRALLHTLCEKMQKHFAKKLYFDGPLLDERDGYVVHNGVAVHIWSSTSIYNALAETHNVSSVRLSAILEMILTQKSFYSPTMGDWNCFLNALVIQHLQLISTSRTSERKSRSYWKAKAP